MKKCPRGDLGDQSGEAVVQLGVSGCAQTLNVYRIGRFIKLYGTVRGTHGASPAGMRVRERPGRRGSVLVLTPAGEQHLAAAARAVRDRLADRLIGWVDGDIATFAQLVTRFNQSRA